MSGASFHIGRDQFHLAWVVNEPPILNVASGSEIDIDALDASCGQITAESTVEDLVASPAKPSRWSSWNSCRATGAGAPQSRASAY